MIHTHYLHCALTQARLGRGFCSPNPAVGAVLVRNNAVIASGYHQGAGSAHAEVDALAKVDDVSGATLYVTLEPCCHHGKTPPCTDLLIKRGIKRVIYGYKDPMRHTHNCGAEVLKKAGVLCERVLVPEIEKFYKSFFKVVTTGKPFVTAKLAISVDGKTAGAKGTPIAITGSELFEITHQHRKEADAILTTVKTIIKDNPRLNARTPSGDVKKPVYVIDPRLEFPLSSLVLKTAKNITLFYDAARKGSDVLRAQGLTCVPVKCDENGLNSAAMFAYIGMQGAHDIWVEAGETYFSSIIEQGLVDRAYLYIAVKVLGQDACSSFKKASTAFQSARRLFWHPAGADIMCVMEW